MATKMTSAEPGSLPLSRLEVSIDAYTLNISAGKRPLRAIQPDGGLLYDEG